MINKIYDYGKNFIKENYKSLIILLVIFLLFTIELPYSIYTPGGAVDLNKRITIEGEYETKGSFNMAYVSMVRGSIPFLLLSKVMPDWDIVKKEDITYQGENMDEMMARERLYLKESQDAAIINAYQKANKELKITKTNNNVSLISEEAKTNLKVGDKILEVKGKTINSLEELQEIVGALKEGEKVDLKVQRNKKEIEAYATTFKTTDGIKIGVGLVTTYEYQEDPEVKIESKASEMGSSGGLMMSLTIYNKLTKNDITKGKKIVGTGTIDILGNVGEIGGVKYKLLGAVKNKADIFMCPLENYQEAKKIAEERNFKIKIISVATFDEAITKLEQI